MELERKQFAMIQASTPTGFGRNISFRMFRSRGNESNEFVDMLPKKQSISSGYGPDFVMSQDSFAIEGTEEELRTNILVRVPIRNFRAKIEKERRASVEILSLMNPEVMHNI